MHACADSAKNTKIILTTITIECVLTVDIMTSQDGHPRAKTKYAPRTPFFNVGDAVTGNISKSCPS